MSLRAQHSLSLAFGLLAMTAYLHAADPVDALIDQEKEALQNWQDDGGELPPAYFWGDKDGAEIYSPAAYEGKGNLICEPMQFDELVELSRGNPADSETILNTALPRVREILQNACLIRPDDSLLAIGAGGQKRVSIKDFIVKKDRPVCPQDSPYSLWVSFSETLDTAPLFYSTDNDSAEGDNAYSSPQPMTVPYIADDARAELKKLIPDLEEFKIEPVVLKSSDSVKIYSLKRKVATPDDDKLANEMLVWQKSQKFDKLWTERVDIKRGSGHLGFKGLLDFNHDGFSDLIIEGDHDKCPYSKVFQGTSDGFRALDLPVTPCVCW